MIYKKIKDFIVGVLGFWGSQNPKTPREIKFKCTRTKQYTDLEFLILLFIHENKAKVIYLRFTIYFLFRLEVENKEFKLEVNRQKRGTEI